MLNTSYGNNVVFEDIPRVSEPVISEEELRREQEEILKPRKAQNVVAWIAHLETVLSTLVWDGLGPLHLMVGAIESSVGGDDVRRHYRWNNSPDGSNTFESRANAVQTGNQTLESFYRRNRHLGTTLLHTVIAIHTRPVEEKKAMEPMRSTLDEEEEEEEELEDPNTPPQQRRQSTFLPFYQGKDSEDTEAINARIEAHPTGLSAQMRVGERSCVIRMGKPEELAELRRLQGDERLYMSMLEPSWVWAVLPKASFRFILNSTTLGGLEMVASELGRLSIFKHIDKQELLFDLISSEEARDVFAEYVGKRINKSSGGNAYQRQMGGNGARGFMISAGFKTRSTNTHWRMGAKLWFEKHLYYAAGPSVKDVTSDLRKELAKLDEQSERVRQAAVPNRQVDAVLEDLEAQRRHIDAELLRAEFGQMCIPARVLRVR